MASTGSDRVSKSDQTLLIMVHLIETTMFIKVAGDPGSVDSGEGGDDFVDVGGDEGEGDEDDEGDEKGLLEDEEGSNEEDVSMQRFGGREKKNSFISLQFMSKYTQTVQLIRI